MKYVINRIMQQQLKRVMPTIMGMGMLTLTACGGGGGSSNPNPNPNPNPTPLPTVDELLPIEHTCSDTIMVKAAELTNDQLTETCQFMADEETLFHTLLETGNTPVAGDLNEQLRVVVFDSEEQYQDHANRLFDIRIDNGGIYIEGDPTDANNIASFYAMECDAGWYGVGGSCEFGGDILNLTHEYVHYLDGRFNLAGGFCDAPNGVCDDFSQPYIVWWGEGLAEYVSKQGNNTKAIDLASNKTYTLSQLFLNSYSHSSDRVYSWGYLAVRFMFENHMDDVRTILGHFRAGDYAAYQTWVNNLGTGYDAEFDAWLGTFGAPDSSTLPDPNTFGDCDLVEPYSRADTTVDISITNNTNTPVILYWISFSTGQPLYTSPYATLSADGTANYSADFWKQGDRMVITDQSDNCLAVAVFTEADNTYVIDASFFQ